MDLRSRALGNMSAQLVAVPLLLCQVSSIHPHCCPLTVDQRMARQRSLPCVCPAAFPAPPGIRNSVGFDWHPATGVLYFTDNGRDKIGDDSPDCELNRMPGPSLAVANSSRQLPDFGFPFCQTQGLGDPYQRDLGGGEPLPDPDLNPDNSVVNCSGARSEGAQRPGGLCMGCMT